MWPRERKLASMTPPRSRDEGRRTATQKPSAATSTVTVARGPGAPRSLGRRQRSPPPTRRLHLPEEDERGRVHQQMRPLWIERHTESRAMLSIEMRPSCGIGPASSGHRAPRRSIRWGPAWADDPHAVAPMAPLPALPTRFPAGFVSFTAGANLFHRPDPASGTRPARGTLRAFDTMGQTPVVDVAIWTVERTPTTPTDIGVRIDLERQARPPRLSRQRIGHGTFDMQRGVPYFLLESGLR